jgi:hypothetical protein
MITTTDSPRVVAARSSKACDVAITALLVGFGALYLSTSATVESYGSDTSTYYSLAKTLLAQHRYWFNFAPHTFYPPGFPVLLAGLMLIAGDSFTVLVRCLATMYFIGAAGLYLYLKRHAEPAVAAAIVAIVVTSYVFYFLATIGMHSDGPFFAVFIFALLSFDIGNSTSNAVRRRVAQVAVAVLGAYLLLVRSIGITFVGALFVWMLAPDRLIWRYDKEPPSRRIKRWLLSALVPVVAFAGWSYWSATHQPHAAVTDYAFSYSRQVLKEDPHRLDSPMVTVKTLPVRVFRMAVTRASNATMMVLNVPNLTLRKVAPLMLVLLGLVTVGFIASLIRSGALLEWYVLLYAGILLIYPYDEGMRYLYPIQPFLILYATRGIDVVHAVFANRMPSLALRKPALLLAKGAVFTGIIGMGLYQISILVRGNLHPDPSAFTNAHTIRSSNWILQNSTPGDVVMDDQDSIVYRLTGRRTFHFPLTTDPSVLRESISDNHVSLIVVPDERKYEYYDPSPAARFERLKRESPGLFVPVYRFDGGTIYRVKGGA